LIGGKSETSEVAADTKHFRATHIVQQLPGGTQLDEGRIAVRSEPIRPVEKLVVGLDVSPFGAIYRTAIGFLALPALSHVVGENHEDGALVPFLLAALLMLRVAPVLLRRIMPFSDWAQRIWAERRQLGKRYDSYQWRKLLWVGMGLALYTVLSGEVTTMRVAVSSTCILVGALGLARWRLVVGPRHDAGRQVRR
jgi:hypothetical protein